MTDSSGVMRAANDFLDAFRNLDWERFRTAFDDNATVFFPPSANQPRRATGKAEIESTFTSVFGKARLLKSHPPYLDIRPKNLNIQTFDNVAIVTFHLEDPGWFGRRTIVFNKKAGKWLIVHLHASAVAASK